MAKKKFITDDITYESVMEIDDDDLDEAIEEAELTKKANKIEFDDLDHARKWLAEQLELEPKKKGKGGGLSIGKKKDAEKPSWDDVHEMDGDALGELTAAHDIDLSEQKFDTLEEAQDAVCEALEIEKEKKGGLKISGKKKDKEEEKPEWSELKKMDSDDLAAVCAKFEIDVDQEFKTIEDARRYIGKELGIKMGGLAGLK